jgi:dihydroorotase
MALHRQSLLLTNARVIDPSRKLDDRLDLLIGQGKILRIGTRLTAARAEVVDLSGLVVAPGFVDMHVHLREPGREESETIRTGIRAAAAGGFTAVACMPNTSPVNDTLRTTKFILQKARKQSLVAVYPIAAVTKNQEGRTLTEMEKLRRAGAVAFSDDGKPVADSQIMRRALELARILGVPIIDHCEDPFLFHGGVMNEGIYSTKLKRRGIPDVCEEIMVSRNILLSRLTDAPVHLAHLSTGGSMDLVRSAKRQGFKVTAEVTPHHFTLTDAAVAKHGTHAKMNPPLRSEKDVEAVLQAISEGTVDAIASDHAPHHVSRKRIHFDQAAFGIIGLETSVSLGLDRLVNRRLISLDRFIELYSLNPAKILGIDRGIFEGAEANLTVFHPSGKTTIRASQFQSKSRNTPFDGWSLRGSPMATICKGQIVWSRLEN